MGTTAKSGSKPRSHAAPQPFTDEPRPAIEMHPVESSQVKAVGYDPQTRTLAVTFVHGVGAIYHYPDVAPDLHQAFLEAESLGTFFGNHIKPLPFKKYRPEQAKEAA